MTFGKPEILATFQKLDDMVQQPTQLCMIGSGPLICWGLPNRSTEDFDLWGPRSKISSDFVRAVTQAGMLWNPKDVVIEANQPYWQVVHPGTVQVGGFAEPQKVWKGRNLSVVAPPWENLIASKLVRSSPKDLEDVQWMVQTQIFDRNKIISIMSRFKDASLIKENLIYLDLFMQQKSPAL
jgi:hypothetical protein